MDHGQDFCNGCVQILGDRMARFNRGKQGTRKFRTSDNGDAMASGDFPDLVCHMICAFGHHSRGFHGRVVILNGDRIVGGIDEYDIGLGHRFLQLTCGDLYLHLTNAPLELG